jgi:hypothetical protein
MPEPLQDEGVAGRTGDGSGGVLAALRDTGFARVAAPALTALLGVERAGLDALRPSWGRLPADAHLRDGGRYRRRRHGSYVVDVARGCIERSERRAHWQPVDYNALHGGFERWFEPIEPDVETSAAWTAAIVGFGRLFARLRPLARWYVEAHQFRIDTTGGIGRPTPEGAHRDGVDFVVIMLVGRMNIRGGESRVFEADGPRGMRFTVTDAWSALLIDDARVIHETTPIQPAGAGAGWRDTLVLTFRADGFLSPGRPKTKSVPSGDRAAA